MARAAQKAQAAQVGYQTDYANKGQGAALHECREFAKGHQQLAEESKEPLTKTDQPFSLLPKTPPKKNKETTFQKESRRSCHFEHRFLRQVTLVPLTLWRRDKCMRRGAGLRGVRRRARFGG